MKQKIYGNRIEPACDVCQMGKRSADGQAVLCAKKGIMPLYHSCRKFIYDPLKREPTPNQQLPAYSPEEFSLD